MSTPYHTISVYTNWHKTKVFKPTAAFCNTLYMIIRFYNLYAKSDITLGCVIRYHIHTTYICAYAFLRYHVNCMLLTDCKQITCYTKLPWADPCDKFSLLIPYLYLLPVYHVDADCLPHCITVFKQLHSSGEEPLHNKRIPSHISQFLFSNESTHCCESEPVCNARVSIRFCVTCSMKRASAWPSAFVCKLLLYAE